MLFSDLPLHPRLQKTLQSAGFTTPTPIQTRALPVALAGQDLIGTAQTGTGKTAAFVLPILQRLLDNPAKQGRSRALIITPTRELAEQINDTIHLFSEGTPIRSVSIYGGVSMLPQERALRAGAEILVVCPGRLLDHMERGTAVLNTIDTLVLDEADRLLDMGFLPSVKRILSKLPTERQTMLFSATFAPELQQLAVQALRDPARVDVGLGAPTKTVSHALYPVSQHLKTALLIRLLRETDTNSVLIFTRTKHRANRVAQQIQRAGFETAVLHSNKSQNQRQLALDMFRDGKVQILVATDIAARGLDIATISHVVNYDMPDTVDTYVHRVGRTGRATREGDAITLTTSEDAITIRSVERVLKAPIERRTVADFDYNAAPPVQNEFQRDPRPQQPRRREPQAPARGREQGTQSRNAAPTQQRAAVAAAPTQQRPAQQRSAAPRGNNGPRRSA